MATNGTSIWTKVDYALVEVPSTGQIDVGATQKVEEQQRFWRWRRPLLDVVGSVLWLYGLLKLFVVDVDTELVGNVAQYRLFFFLAVATVLVLVFKRKWPIIAAFGYVCTFPLVVLAWKLPKLIFKARSPVVLLAALNAVVSVLAQVKHSVLVGTAFAFAALVITLSHSRVVLGIAGCVMLYLLVDAVFRTIRSSVAPARFMRMQQRGIKRALDSKLMGNLISPGDDLLRPDIERFDKVQLDLFVQRLGTGVLANRFLKIWAYQLERYRRSPSALLFNGLSYLWLVVRVVLALAFLNLALYHADPSAFKFATAPTFLTFVRYVSAGLYASEIRALEPRSDLATGLSIATFGFGLVMLGSLLLSLVLSYKSTRDESEIRDTIAQIKAEGRRLDERLRADYEVSLSEAINRLEQLKYGLMGLVTFLSTRIPREFEENGPS